MLASMHVLTRTPAEQAGRCCRRSESRRSGFLRAVGMAVAMLQLVVPFGAALADVALERRASSSPDASHVEATSTAQCTPVHSARCALCQFMARRAIPSTPTSTPLGGSIAVADSPFETAHPPAFIAGALPFPRAPPALF